MFSTMWLSALLLFFSSPCMGEFFTSMSHLKSLTQIEAAYYEKLKALVTKREQQLEVLKRFHEKVKHIETVDAREYIKHPVNAFLAIKRLRQDWQYFQKVADTDHSEGRRYSALKWNWTVFQGICLFFSIFHQKWYFCKFWTMIGIINDFWCNIIRYFPFCALETS